VSVPPGKSYGESFLLAGLGRITDLLTAYLLLVQVLLLTRLPFLCHE
jgi:hypothetical protein